MNAYYDTHWNATAAALIATAAAPCPWETWERREPLELAASIQRARNRCAWHLRTVRRTNSVRARDLRNYIAWVGYPVRARGEEGAK